LEFDNASFFRARFLYFSTEKSKIISQVFGEAESYSEVAIRSQEIFNLADTFKNLLKALKHYQKQSEQYRLSNISALRTKLQDNSFENLIDISKETSVTRLLVDTASYFEKLNWGQKTFTHKGLIQEFEDFVKNFRFDLIENPGTDGWAYQLCYNQFETYSYEYKTGSPIEYKYFEKKNNLKVNQGHIQEGQNPKELVDGLIQIQGILKQLQSRITKIPIIELTPEQIEDKQYLDEAFQDIESFFQVLPNLTTRELFVKLFPNKPIPENIEEFEWLVEYIERERTLKFEKDIEAVAASNLAENKALTKVLNPIFAPDQSIEFELEYGYYPNNLKNLWDKIQSIQALFNLKVLV
jgi:hypothetical protein